MKETESITGYLGGLTDTFAITPSLMLVFEEGYWFLELVWWRWLVGLTNKPDVE